MRILIAEDDLTSRTVLAEVLKKQGHEVVTTANGADAWQIMQGPDAPRMVILDWIMPEMDGLELCRRIRARNADRPPYLILLTARGEKKDISVGLDSGADDYMIKPLDAGEIRARVDVGQRMIASHDTLVASERKYQELFESVPIGLYKSTLDGKILAANPACLEIAHCPPSERESFFALNTPQTYIHSEDRLRFREKLIAEGQVRGFESALRLYDGSVGWVSNTAKLVRDARGNPEFISGSFEDITGRKRAEQALRESEEKFFKAFQTAPFAIAITRVEDGKLVDVNDALLHITGFPREKLLAHTTIELKVWANESDREYVVAEVLAGRTVDEKEFLFRRNGGEIFTGLFSAQSIRLGEKEHILSCFHDITEKKRNEESLKLLATAIEQAGEVVVVTDTEGRIQYANPAFETVTGYSPAEALGQNPRFLKSGMQDESFYRELWNTLTGGKVWHGRFVNRKKDGTYYTEDAVLSPVRNPNGQITNYVGVKRDITEELNLQSELLQSQKMESVGRLAGGVAHDFNNILQVILGNTELALTHLDPSSPMYSDLKDIQIAGRRASDLTRQLLAFARRQTITPRVLDLNKVVEGGLKMLQRLIGENIELVWKPHAGLWPIQIDPGQIDQILVNLCINARDAIPDTGTIYLATENVHVDEIRAIRKDGFLPGDYAVLSVSDTGRGMTPEIMSRIFEPFYTTKDVGKGTGLGLPTVYGIVRQNQGHIGVYSEPGRGTTFRIYLRRNRGPSPGADAESEKPADRGSETVLLVEDDHALLGMSTRMLQKLGYTVRAARTTDEALRLAEKSDTKIDLLVTDVIMPGMNGRELSEQIKKIRPGLRCLFMSGFPADVIAHHNVLDSGTHFIQKPFLLRDLAAKVREVMSMDGPSA